MDCTGNLARGQRGNWRYASDVSDEFSLEPEPPPPQPPAAPEPAVPPAPPPVPEPGPTVVAAPPEPPRPPQTGGPADAWSIPFRRKLMGWFDDKNIGAATLIVVAAGVAMVAALLMSINHVGFGAVLGMGAVATAWVARVRRFDDEAVRDPARPFVLLVSDVVTAVLLGGFMLAAAEVPVHAFVRAALLAGLLLLPLARHMDNGHNLPKGPVVLSWFERLTLLMLGCMLGNPALMAFLLVGIVAADLLVRLAMLRPGPTGRAALPPGLASCFRPDGSLLPPIRWALLAVPVLLCIVFGTEDSWRF